jgi:hypothetical protein
MIAMTCPTRRSTLVLSPLLLILLLAGCGREKKPPDTWPLGFRLPIDPSFLPSGTQRPNGEGSLFFLCGEEPDKPRLVVRKRALRLGLDESLEEELQLGEDPVVLERGEPFGVRAVNAAGLGVRQTVSPFPRQDSTLVLLYDTRVFAVGNFCFSFVWQQLPEDSLLLARYEGWMAHLTFLADGDAADTPREP